MQTKSSVNNVRMSPIKVRRILQQIRGKKALEATLVLNFLPHAAARALEKILKSAIANAEHNHQVPAAKLYITECFADQGPTLKRFQPHAQGRAFPIKKRTSHITIVVGDRPEVEAPKAKAAAKAEPAESQEN